MEISAIASIPRASSLPISSSNSIFFNSDRTNLLLKNSTKSKCLVLRRNRAQRGLTTRCLFGLGVPELAVIAGVVALVFGPKKLPEVGRSIGKTVKSFQQVGKMMYSTDSSETSSDASDNEWDTTELVLCQAITLNKFNKRPYRTDALSGR
ncbi:Sec-independent protein translocase protein tata protein, partial [Thalictrum thalictroides]